MNRKTEMPKHKPAKMTDKHSKKEEYSGGMKEVKGPGSKEPPKQKNPSKKTGRAY